MRRIEDLEEAIRTAQQTIEITPQKYPDLVAKLNNLGSKLKSRFERTGRMKDLKEVIYKT